MNQVNNFGIIKVSTSWNFDRNETTSLNDEIQFFFVKCSGENSFIPTGFLRSGTSLITKMSSLWDFEHVKFQK